MDLKRLRTFVTVADEGSVSKAALRLRIAQPALSRQIADLETELGLKLFDRVGRRLHLTGEGEQLLGSCRSLLGSAVSLAEQAQSLRRGDVGLLKVAASPQIIESVFSTFLPRYADRFPNVQVKLSEAVGMDQVTLLQAGEVHVCVGLMSAVQRFQGELGTHPLPPVEFLAACHASHELAQRDTIDIAHLAPYSLLLLDSSFALRKTFDAACRLAGLEPNILIESRAPHTLLALAEAGQGVAIIQSAVPIDRYRVQVVRITHRRKPILVPMTIMWNKRRRLPRYADAFCKLLAEHMGSLFPISRPTKLKIQPRKSRANKRKLKLK